jgi:serine/threonine-protein kinase
VSDILARLQSALSDRYGIQRELGRGGMATVYLATDLKHDREVAIKVLHPELAATLGPERFDREIKFAAKLQHPNILGLFDSGVADGLLYYVMPFVYGESLRERLNRDHMLPVDFAIHVTLEVADALGYAHSMGIIHRDIKPENIMLSGGHALVADFGIARAVTEAGSAQKLTETGMAVGTPLYMSPEQAVGDQVGPTSDLYSLACVLYEMLAGQPPFSGSNARQIMARHAMEQVPSIQVVRDTVPDQVEDAIMAALNKVVADRPQTAAQFVELLGAPPGATASRYAAVSRASVSRRTASRLTPPGAVTLTVKRRSLVGAAVAAGLSLLLIGGALAWYLTHRENVGASEAGGLDPHRVAVLYLEDLSTDKHLGFVADGLTEALIGALTQVPVLKVISAGGVGAWRDPAIPRDSVGRALQAGTLVQGTVEPVGDKLRVQLRLVDGNSGVDLSSRRASFDLPAGDLLKVRDSLAGDAAELIRKRLGEEIRVREQREGTSNVAAWSLLQRAQALRKQGETAAKTGDEAGMIQAFHEADSLSEQAAGLDRQWPDPLVLRGLLAYRRSYVFGQSDGQRAAPWIDSGLVQVARALPLRPGNPDALELRGELRYWRWLLQLERDDAKAKTLLLDAQNDLEQATRINPAQAGAWAVLSHLYNQTKGGVDVALAARRALDADAFLDNADKILQRLFLVSYDLGQFPDAVHWCEETGRRFPATPLSVRCRLWLLTTKVREPDVREAWRLADSLTMLSPEQTRAYDRLYNNLLVAGVLGRAGLTDSARRVAERSKGDPIVDPQGDLAFVGAFAYALMGDKAQAIERLKAYFAASPGRREAFKDDAGWWFRDLQNEPAYQQLIGNAK